METTFYCLLDTGSSKHDKTEYFEQHKTLKEFQDWILSFRLYIKKETGKESVVLNMDVLRNKI